MKSSDAVVTVSNVNKDLDAVAVAAAAAAAGGGGGGGREVASRSSSSSTFPTPLKQQHHPTKFTITYAKNCDGGMQEMATAAMCIRDVYPTSKIETVRLDSGPLKVTISATTAAAAVQNNDIHSQKQEGPTITVWTGKQQDLFERTPKRRRRTIKIIKQALLQLSSMSSFMNDTKKKGQQEIVPVPLPSPTITTTATTTYHHKNENDNDNNNDVGDDAATNVSDNTSCCSSSSQTSRTV